MNKRSRLGVLGKRESTEGILLYLPAILIVFGIVFFPMAYAMVMSFTGYRVSKPVMNFIGLKNYTKILADPGFGDAVLRSIVFTFGSLIPQIVLGLAMAMLLNSPRLRCKTLFRGLAITPWLIPTVAVAIVFRWMFNDIYGIINHAAIGMGFIEDSFAWLSNSTGAMFVMILAMGVCSQTAASLAFRPALRAFPWSRESMRPLTIAASSEEKQTRLSKSRPRRLVVISRGTLRSLRMTVKPTSRKVSIYR